MTSNRPENAKHRADYVPRWRRFRPPPRSEEDPPPLGVPSKDPRLARMRPVRRPELVDTDADIRSFAESFVALMGEDLKPTADAVVARIQFVLRHARDTQQKVVVISRTVPPYFGVTTQRADVVVEEVEDLGEDETPTGGST